MKTNLVLQSFGKMTEYKRAIFTICSYFVYSNVAKEETGVLLFTDNPEYFKPYLKGLPVQYIQLSPEKIKSMRGRIDFLHRMKIAVIEEAFGLINGLMLYVDSDTFFIADPTQLINKVSPQRAFMHVREYEFDSMRSLPLPGGKTFQAFLKLIENQYFFLANGNQIKVSSTQSSWNAGVMFFHPTHARFIPDVYALTDQFYPATQNHASEQYAFSIILQNNAELAPCDTVVFHYWYRVKKQVMDLFLKKKVNDNWKHLSIDAKILKVKEWTIDLPTILEKHLLTLKDNSICEFDQNNYRKGYKWALQAFANGALLDFTYIKDVLYHVKRHLKHES